MSTAETASISIENAPSRGQYGTALITKTFFGIGAIYADRLARRGPGSTLPRAAEHAAVRQLKTQQC
jgi:hypothetical protein